MLAHDCLANQSTLLLICEDDVVQIDLTNTWLMDVVDIDEFDFWFLLCVHYRFFRGILLLISLCFGLALLE